MQPLSSVWQSTRPYLQPLFQRIYAVGQRMMQTPYMAPVIQGGLSLGVVGYGVRYIARTFTEPKEVQVGTFVLQRLEAAKKKCENLEIYVTEYQEARSARYVEESNNREQTVPLQQKVEELVREVADHPQVGLEQDDPKMKKVAQNVVDKLSGVPGELSLLAESRLQNSKQKQDRKAKSLEEQLRVLRGQLESQASSLSALLRVEDLAKVQVDGLPFGSFVKQFYSEVSQLLFADEHSLLQGVRSGAEVQFESVKREMDARFESALGKVQRGIEDFRSQRSEYESKHWIKHRSLQALHTLVGIGIIAFGVGVFTYTVSPSLASRSFVWVQQTTRMFA